LVASESPDIAQPQWLVYFLRLSFAVAAQAPEGGVSLVEQVAESHNCAIFLQAMHSLASSCFESSFWMDSVVN
jgi:hypothetical protein